MQGYALFTIQKYSTYEPKLREALSTGLSAFLHCDQHLFCIQNLKQKVKRCLLKALGVLMQSFIIQSNPSCIKIVSLIRAQPATYRNTFLLSTVIRSAHFFQKNLLNKCLFKHPKFTNIKLLWTKVRGASSRVLKLPS